MRRPWPYDCEPSNISIGEFTILSFDVGVTLALLVGLPLSIFGAAYEPLFAGFILAMFSLIGRCVHWTLDLLDG